jgi:hypothetical protein
MPAGPRGRKLLLGFVVLHVLCCGLPLLLAAGLVTGVGGLLRNPVVLGVGVALLGAALLPALRRARAERDDDCCRPATRPETSTRDASSSPHER